MMRRTVRFAIPLLMAASAASVFTFAMVNANDQAGDQKKTEETKKNEPRKSDASAQAIMNVAAAYQMAEWGRQQKAPEALIAAARVIGTTKISAPKYSEKDQVSKKMDVDEVKEAKDLIKEALAMAGKSATIEALAKDATAAIEEKTRSPFGGARQWSSFFRGDGVDIRDRYYVDLRGGEYTWISLNGYGPPGLDLDLELYNQFGQLVASERSIGPNAFIQVFVPQPGTYCIHAINFSGYTPCQQYILRAY